MSNFLNKVINSIDNDNCHIIPTIQNLILYYGDTDNPFNLPQGVLLAGEASNLNPEGLLKSQSRVWVPLIWNAFNFLNYDVPETWLNIDLEEDNKKKILNISKRLSKIKNWDKYAILVLNDAYNIKFEENDNDFNSNKVIELSKKYNNLCKN